MRKTIKIGIIMLVAGVILLIFGIANNGIQSIYWDKGFKIVKTSSKTYYPDKITAITLSSGDNVTVTRGDVPSIRVSSRQKLPTITTKNGHVTVSSPTQGAKQVGYFFSNRDWDNRTVITVPAKTKLTWIRGTDKQSGDVRLHRITTKELQLNNSSSDVTLSDVTVKKAPSLEANALTLSNVTAPSLSVSTGTNGGNVRIFQSHLKGDQSTITNRDGDITIEETQLSTAKVHTDDGDIRLLRNHVERLTATSSDGDIRLSANRQVGVLATTLDGDLNIFGHRHSDDDAYRYRPNAKQQYHLSTDDGDIAVH